MSSPNVVVDGSNIATEGRSAPSLAQLDEAVREYLRENPDAVVTVVVDATFGHRIDESERQMFEEARSAGEIISPPAGAIGRGDAFLLRIAEKTGATVLSNDSFQEFHGEHDWLFTTGRLVGGVPVAGVGWIFTPRTPVRGPRSREAVKAAKRQRPAPPPRKSAPTPRAPRPDGKPQIGDSRPAPEPKPPAAGRRGRPSAAAVAAVDSAIAEATEEVVHPTEGGGRRRRRRRAPGPPSEPLNRPLDFINFVGLHRLGTKVQGEVESFSSHGAFVIADGVRCYVPLSAMGEPPPRSAREVLTKGEVRQFVVQALDPPRRGVELALPEFVRVAGAPTDETVEAEITEAAPAQRRAGARKAPGKSAPAKKKVATKKTATKGSAKKTPAKKTATKAAPARASAKSATTSASTKKTATKAPAKKTPAKKASAKKAATKAAPAKASAKKSATKSAAPKKTAAKAPAKKAPAKKTTAKKTPAKKTATKKTATKAAPAKAPAKKSATKSTPAKKTAAKKTTAKKAAKRT